MDWRGALIGGTLALAGCASLEGSPQDRLGAYQDSLRTERRKTAVFQRQLLRYQAQPSEPEDTSAEAEWERLKERVYGTPARDLEGLELENQLLQESLEDLYIALEEERRAVCPVPERAEPEYRYLAPERILGVRLGEQYLTFPSATLICGTKEDGCLRLEDIINHPRNPAATLRVEIRSDTPAYR